MSMQRKHLGTGLRASIIIPAYNEARVIGRSLARLLEAAEPGEFDVVVVCNGCSDDTESVARSAGGEVRVFSIDQASKSAALNHADQLARTYPRVYLDADLEVSTAAIRALIDALDDAHPAAIGFMDIDTKDRPWLVRSFYRLWRLHPYLRDGKFGGVYALNRTGCEVRGVYPGLLGDDEYVRNRFTQGQCRSVAGCRFRVFAPYTVSDIFRIRSRVYLGNLQLRDAGLLRADGSGESTRRWLRGTLSAPSNWPALPVYIAVNLLARLNAHRLHWAADYQWLRDNSSRAGAAG